MPRKESKVVPEGNGPVHQRKKLGSGQPTLEGVYRGLEQGFRKVDSYLDQMNRKLKEITDEKKSMDQHETSLEQDAR